MLTRAGATASENDTTASDFTEEAVTPLASDTTDVVPAADVAGESTTNPLAPMSTVVTPMTNAVVTVVGVMGTVPGVVAGLPASETPVSDVITSIEAMLTSVTDAVLPLVSVPTDLYTMLVGAEVAATTIGGGAGFGVGPVAAADSALVPPAMATWPQVLPSSDIWGAHGDVAALATAGGVATAGLSEKLSISGAAPLVMQGATPTGVLPVLEHAVRALLVPASLLLWPRSRCRESVGC